MLSFVEMCKKTKLEKFTKDIFWNMLSVLILAIGGTLLVFIIAIRYSADTLGVFKQAMAVLTIVSQISVWGIHNSVLKHVAQFKDNKKEIKQIISSGLFLTIVISVGIAFLTAGIFYCFGNVLFGEKVVEGVYYVIPAIIFLSINKIFIWSLNGESKMFEYAVAQSLRYIFMLVYLVVLIIFNTKSQYVSLLLTFSEMTLFIVLFVYFLKRNMFVLPNKKYIKEHLSFGSKIIFGGLIVEFNTKIDILILGIFTNDYVVGIYSFAIVFVDGFMQVFMVFRRNLNPMFTHIYYTSNHIEESTQELDNIRATTITDNIKKIINIKEKVENYILPLMSVGSSLLILVFPFITVFLVQPRYIDGFIPLIIILLCMGFNSVYIVFGNILLQTGFPEQETILNLFTVIFNLILNLILIPIFGMIGSALATGLSYYANAIFLRNFAKRMYGFYLYA